MAGLVCCRDLVFFNANLLTHDGAKRETEKQRDQQGEQCDQNTSHCKIPHVSAECEHQEAGNGHGGQRKTPFWRDRVKRDRKDGVAND